MWGNAAFRQQTVLSEAYQGHMQKNVSLIAKFPLYLNIINKLVSLQLWFEGMLRNVLWMC